MNIINSVIKNVLSNWTGLLVNLIISFFLAPFVVNKLGSNFYGIWVIMMQFTGYLYLLDFGVRESVIRYVSKYKALNHLDQLDNLINASFKVYFGFSAFCMFITILFLQVFHIIFNIQPDLINVTRYVIFLSGVNIAQFFLFNVFIGVLMGVQRYDILNNVSIIFAFIRVGLIYYFLNEGCGIIALAYIQLFVNLSSNIIILILSKKVLNFKINIFRKVIETKQIYKSIASYSIIVLAINLCQKIIFYTDAMIIGIFLTSSAITYYAIAGNLIEYLRNLVLSMTSVLNPLASELDTKNQNDKIVEVLLNGTKCSLLLGFPVSAVFFILGERFIYLWMGPEFAKPSYAVLSILAVTHFLSLPHFTVSMILYGKSRHKILAIVKGIEALANIILSLMLVKPFGIVGVAIGTAIPHIIAVTLVYPKIISRIVGVDLFEYYYKAYLAPIISGGPFIAICYLMRSQYVANNLFAYFSEILLILPFYVLPAWILSFNKEERQWHLSYIKKRIRK